MRNIARSRFCVGQNHFWPVILASAVILLFGCQAREAPLSPGAASFKQEIKTCFTNLTATLIEPVATKDVAGIKAALEQVESPAAKLCRLCPFEIGVLNPVGVTMASYPGKGEVKTDNFSNYEVVIKAIKTQKIQKQQLFLQDGAKLYLICAPLLRDNTLIGLVAIAVSSEDAKKRWGIDEKEFLGLDFNT